VAAGVRLRFNTADRTVVISGDTSPSPALIENCQRCDVLIHEAFSEDSRPEDFPNWLEYRSKYHTTTTQLAEIANKSQPRLLVVYHWGAGTPEHVLTEIQRTYRGSVFIAQDLDVYYRGRPDQKPVKRLSGNSARPARNYPRAAVNLASGGPAVSRSEYPPQ
jgi:ribonuclease BN (tRNA processing enzyme)